MHLSQTLGILTEGDWSSDWVDAISSAFAARRPGRDGIVAGEGEHVAKLYRAGSKSFHFLRTAKILREKGRSSERSDWFIIELDLFTITDVPNS